MPFVGLHLSKSAAVETLQLCAQWRAGSLDPIRALCTSVRRHAMRAADTLPAPPLVIYVAIAAALGSACFRAGRRRDAAALLDADEYRRRYELGRRRYLEQKTIRRARKQAWMREHGPWLLLTVAAALWIAVLILAQPQRFIVITSLLLYSGLAWLVCWVVRASRPSEPPARGTER
jgi:hypothetical protein